jgi:SAM-dependent methyltransferase
MLHQFFPGDGTTLPVADHTVDLVVFDSVMEHILEPKQFVAELIRVIRPGGRILYRTMQRWSAAGVRARLAPNLSHPKPIRWLQPEMSAEDVYPAAVRANGAVRASTVSATRRLFAATAANIDTIRCTGPAGHVPIPRRAAAGRFEQLAPKWFAPKWFAPGLVVDVTLAR